MIHAVVTFIFQTSYLVFKAVILWPPAIGVLVATSMLWNIVWWVVWLAWMMWICATPVGDKSFHAVSWILIPLVIWLEAFQDSKLATAAVILWGLACFNYGIHELRVGTAKHMIAKYGAARDKTTDEGA